MKLIISITVSIIALMVVFYFLFYRPAQIKQDVVNIKQECFQQASFATNSAGLNLLSDPKEISYRSCLKSHGIEE